VAGLALVGIASISAVATLAGTSWAGLLALLRLPETEMRILQGIPAQGWHLAILASVPLLLQWGAIYAARGVSPLGGDAAAENRIGPRRSLSRG
jgi:hypothetical protein